MILIFVLGDAVVNLNQSRSVEVLINPVMSVFTGIVAAAVELLFGSCASEHVVDDVVNEADVV